MNVEPTPAPSVSSTTSTIESKKSSKLDSNDIIGISIGIPSFLATLAGVLLVILPKPRQKLKQLLKRKKTVGLNVQTANGIEMSPSHPTPVIRRLDPMSPLVSEGSKGTVTSNSAHTHVEPLNQTT